MIKNRKNIVNDFRFYYSFKKINAKYIQINNKLNNIYKIK